MFAIVMPAPKPDFSTLSGIPLTGGKLYTFAAGTSTPKDTFTVEDGSVSQTNPIILNSRGEPPSPIFWNGSYRVELRDALDNVIYTVDNFQTPVVTDALASVDGAGAVGFDYDIFYAAGTIGKWLQGLASSIGTSLIGFVQAGAGAVLRTLQVKVRETVSLADFGAVGDDATDNTAAFARVVAYLATFSGSATLPKVIATAGIYRYAAGPNWGLQGLAIEARGNVVFYCTGPGKAFTLDGGAAGGGKYRIRITGKLRVKGNAATTDAIYVRAIHHSYFEMEARDCTTVLRTEWTVCNEYRISCTPVGDPAFAVTPTNGIVLDQRAAGETTSACTFHNPIIEGVISYGINLAAAVQNTFIGGTSESNGGGIFVSASSAFNKFINTDLEFNTGADIFCNGVYNSFDGVLSDRTATFNGTANHITGGTYDVVNNGGANNEFSKVQYGRNTGGFFDTGTNTVKRSVRSIFGGGLDSDMMPQKVVAVRIEGTPISYTWIGNGLAILGTTADDIVHFHYSTGATRFWHNSAETFAMGPGSISFFGAALQPKIFGTPPAATDLASALTLLNFMRSSNLSYGLTG